MIQPRIKVEHQRVVDDRTRLLASHREYVNHLKLTHQAAQDIKDNKSVYTYIYIPIKLNKKIIYELYLFF
jgi:hypothetical protein